MVLFLSAHFCAVRVIFAHVGTLVNRNVLISKTLIGGGSQHASNTTVRRALTCSTKTPSLAFIRLIAPMEYSDR